MPCTTNNMSGSRRMSARWTGWTTRSYMHCSLARGVSGAAPRLTMTGKNIKRSEKIKPMSKTMRRNVLAFDGRRANSDSGPNQKQRLASASPNTNKTMPNISEKPVISTQGKRDSKTHHTKICKIADVGAAASSTTLYLHSRALHHTHLEELMSGKFTVSNDLVQRGRSRPLERRVRPLILHRPGYSRT